MAPQPAVNGVLPASVLQKNAPASAPRGPKATQPRLKLVLRRLPPGLTKAEFENVLGDEWKLGAGKVDWMLYKKGKISKDLAKPSRPSRAYLHVTSQSYVPVLGDHVRQASFNDAAKSAQDNALIGPPTLEFAPYHRMPGGRRKNDNRQGTIDQDQEFKDFLESLTNPITKPAAPENEAHKDEKAKTTPLIEALREKKANKDKPQAKSSKHGRGESKEEATEKKILIKGSKDAVPASAEKGKRPSKAEKAAAAKEAVKVLNKEAASSKETTKSPATDKTAAPSATPERKRGNVNIAKSMLQRDLGIGPAANRRRGTKREVAPASTPDTTAAASGEATADKQKPKETPAVAATVASSDKNIPPSPKKPSRAERRAFKATLADKSNSKTTGEEPKTQAKTPGPPTILKKPQPAQNPKGPAASRAPPTEPAASRAVAPQPQVAPTKPEVRQQTPTQPTVAPSAPAPTGRQAFLKHANPSQGITEPLLEEALNVFGVIEKVEIDKRKGFAYVDFADSDGLQKAIAASPVKVAQGAVQVLERKEKVVRNRPHPHPHVHPGPHGPPTGPARGRGGFAPRGRGRGGARGGGHLPSTNVGEALQTAPVPAPVPASADAAT